MHVSVHARRALAVAALGLAAPAAAQPVTTPDQAEPASQAPPDQTITRQATEAAGRAVADLVSGRVVDALGRPVSGAHVTLEAGSTTTTGKDGRFRLAAPIGSTLIIDHEGFDVALANVTGEALDDVVMLPAGTNAEKIEIRGQAPATSPGAAQLDRSELSRIPGTGGDVMRAVTAMPGVVNLQIPTGYTGVAMRGSSPQDSKVMIDGFEVPMLFHDIAFRSVIPGEAIASLDYIPGGFDVSIGHASSGIIAMTTRPGSTARSEQAEVSLIDGGVLAQGSLGDRTRYMLGVRRSTIDLLLPSLLPDDADLSLTTVPRYYDAQLRIDHDLSARWHLMLSALGADDMFSLVASKDKDATAKKFSTHTNFLRATAAASYRNGEWSAQFALSGMLPKFDAANGLYQKIKFSYPMVTPRAEVSRSIAKLGGLSEVVWRSGAELQVTRADIDVAVGQEPREGEPPPIDDPKDTTTTFKGIVWMPDGAAWSSLAANLHPKIRLTGGVRADVFGRGEEVAVQPRGELQIKLPAKLTARLSAGLYNRAPEYQTETLYSNLKSERSLQTIANLTYEPQEGARVQASAYYTDRARMITHRMDGSLANDGNGRTMGAELLATYRGGPWFGWLSYAYSHSTRVDRPGAERRLFDFDQPHSLNAAASWQHGRWQLGGRFQLYSGLPFTPATGSILDSDRNLYMPEYGAVNSERAPYHHQLDLRVDYSWKWGPAAMTAFLDVQNVYMNESVVTYFYNYDYSQRAAFKSIPLIPSLGLRGVL